MVLASPGSSSGGTVTVRYWAAAKAAAGVASDEVPVSSALPVTLADVLALVRARHVDRPRFADVASVCSLLVGERPVGAADPTTVPLRAGDVVELLPPFAGG